MRDCKLLCLTLISLFAGQAFADDAMIWRCSAIDSVGKTWSSQSAYVKTAQTKAHEACKKQSSTPWKCFSSRELCEIYQRGATRSDFWRCTAFNSKTLHKWRSGPYTKRMQAAMGALKYCETLSKHPDSCYMNMITCRKVK